MTSIDPTHVWTLVLIAAKLSGYPLPGTAPMVYELSHQEFQAKFCPGNLKECGDILGRYADTGIVWVDKDATDESVYKPGEDSSIVHELVHWLQDKNGMSGPEPNEINEANCTLLRVREKEAYMVQNRYIQEVLGKDLVVGKGVKVCGESVLP